jgi:hypothetical protein
MIVHQGENVIIGTFFEAINGSFNLADYDIKVKVSNLRGAVALEKTTEIIHNDADNTVACTITGSETKTMKGLYFVFFELWANGEKVLSNEVEQIEVIK